jgi:hypothetical protein
VSVELANRWHSASFGPLAVRFRRPPQIERGKAELIEGRPFAAVSARVQSASALTGAEVEVVSRSTDPPKRQVVRPKPEAAGDAWVVAAEVALEPGLNEVVVRTRNEDGVSEALSKRLVYTKPVEPKPEVTLLTPEKVGRRPASTVRFQVVSRSPLSSVKLFRLRAGGEREPVGPEFEAKKAGRRADGMFELVGETGVRLAPYQNSFEVVAANAGGESVEKLTLSYTPPPVRVEIVGVGSDAEPGRTIGPQERLDGPPTLAAPLADGRATILGRVVWSDADPKDENDRARVQVWVNGFPHVAAVLGPAKATKAGLVREFEARVLLSRLRNEVVVKLRDVPLDIHGDPKLGLDCRRPERNIGLHLWVIGLHAGDEQALVGRAMAALKGRITSKVSSKKLTFSTPAFPAGTVYGPEANGLTRHRATNYLKAIAKNIPISDRPSNDVVMIYYEGDEVVAGERASLQIWPANGADPGELIPLSEIRRYLSESRGAKLFLLDVTHSAAESPLVLAEAAQWVKDELPFGLLRFSWPGPARPAGANLYTVMGEAINKATTVGEVSEELGRQSLALSREVPGFKFSPELPAAVSAMIISGQ